MRELAWMAAGRRRAMVDAALVSNGGLKSVLDWIETGSDGLRQAPIRLDPELQAKVERHRAAQRRAGRFVMPEEVDQYAPPPSPSHHDAE